VSATSCRRWLVWNEANAVHWEVELDGDGGADSVVCGRRRQRALALFRFTVRYPDIEGLADFSGDVMHTPRKWDATVDPDRKGGGGSSATWASSWRARLYPNLPVRQAQTGRSFPTHTPPWMVPKPDRSFSARSSARFPVR